MSGAAEVLDALARRDLRAAMGFALGWWRVTPAPSLAEQLVRLEALTPEAERDGVTARLAQVIVGGNSVKSRENVEALAKAPADPRLTDFLIATLGAPPFDLSSGNPEAFAGAVAALLVKQRDPRVATWRKGLDGFLAAHAGTRRGQLSVDEIATLRRIFAGLKVARAPVIPAAVEAEVGRFSAALAPFAKATTGTREQHERLLADVIAHFDDAHLQVFGDWLTERGAPQGELIARMLAGTTSGLESLQQQARPACFAGATLTWEKGVPVKALFANRDGVRAGSWGPELEWGTIRETDVVPPDGCHAQRLEALHVGTSFVKDLAKRTQPLGVKTLGVLSLTSTSRAPWKKVTALRGVEQLEVRRVDQPSELGWFLATDVGKAVRRVVVTFADDPGQLLSAARGLFDAAPKLEALELSRGVTVAREGRGVRCELALTNAVHVQELVRAFRDVPRPVCDVVVLVGPQALTAAPELRSLGARATTRVEASVLLDRVGVERREGRVVLTPKHQEIFDAAALGSFLERESCDEVELACGVDFREAAALWALASAHSVRELVLRRGSGERHVELGPHAHWYFSRFSLTLRALELVCESGRGGGDLLEAAVAGLPRVAKATLRAPGGVEAGERAQLEQALRKVADEVVLAAVDPASQLTLKYVKSRKRLEVRTALDAAPLAPATLDAVLAKQPAVEAVDVFQRTLALAPWIAWVATTKLPLAFRVPNQTPEYPVRVWWEDGLRVFLSVRQDLERTLPKALFALPAESVAVLELSHWTAPASAWVEAGKHVAKKLIISSSR